MVGGGRMICDGATDCEIDGGIGGGIDLSGRLF